MAGNPIAQSLAEKTAHVQITWMNWFVAAIIPGLISLIVVPFIIYKLYPPTVKETPNAKKWATEQLEKKWDIYSRKIDGWCLYHSIGFVGIRKLH